jgi:hypothetical protein
MEYLLDNGFLPEQPSDMGLSCIPYALYRSFFSKCLIGTYCYTNALVRLYLNASSQQYLSLPLYRSTSCKLVFPTYDIK